ncbi:hypothetical protein ACFL5Z_03680 [Planctomycetota bacterium]
MKTGSFIFLVNLQFNHADKETWLSLQRLERKNKVGKQMFEPEYENLTCPKCHTREVYFDRQMGHYCMFCGRQFSTEEVEALLEQELCHINADE